jgi:hypothetical protein
MAYLRLLHTKNIFLELTPPAFTDKTPFATEQLFSVIHQSQLAKAFLPSFIRRKIFITLECISSKEQGIRFVACVPEEKAGFFKQNLATYLPDVRVEEIVDYLPSQTALSSHERRDPQFIGWLSFKLSRHFAFPLNIHTSLSQHDPVAYITGAMTKLEPNELISFQLVISPVDSGKTRRIRNKLLNGKMPNLSNKCKQT